MKTALLLVVLFCGDLPPLDTTITEIVVLAV